MSVLTRKHHTKLSHAHEAILHFVYQGHVYNIPKKVAEKYEDRSKSVRRINSDEVFSDIENQYTKAGVLLRGTRHREGLTQAQMAKKIKVTQADLSKMENGKRSIGKIIAKRIEKKFGVNYRYFLE